MTDLNVKRGRPVPRLGPAVAAWSRDPGGGGGTHRRGAEQRDYRRHVAPLGGAKKIVIEHPAGQNGCYCGGETHPPDGLARWHLVSPLTSGYTDQITAANV